MGDENFWMAIDRLVSENPVEIDRVQGMVHPLYPDMVYPLDYGYLVGTTASDGGGIDVWVGTSGDKRAVGVICSIDLVKRDTEIKIMLGCHHEEMRTVLAFMRENGMGCLLIEREQNGVEKR
jgi:inorganic pyrophosphatase